MRSSALRHVVRLRLTLVGPVPEIWREVVIDRDLTLADLQRVIQSVFEGQTCSHHVFTDSLDNPGWSRSRRRWGDRETMIDLRDPTVIDEATARIGRVLREERALFYGHTCEYGWLVEIEQYEDDLVEASTPPARVTGGERRAPLPCCRGAYEHAVLVGVLEDAAHPEHEALRRSIAQTVGPWSHYDPEEFDLDAAQRAVDARALREGAPHAAVGRVLRASARRARAGSPSRVVARLPRPARAGLERHLTASGLDLPAVVTTDEAQAVTREFSWIISRAARGGIPFIDGQVDPDIVQEGVEALGCDDDRMRRLIALAKRGRLLYLRSGRLLASKRSIAAAESPVELWSLLAREVVRVFSPHTSGELFLLAIADGSLADPTIGARRSAEALALIWDRERYGAGHYSYGYDADPYGGECEQPCDCPGAETWHDVVARAIRDAATHAAGDEAVPVARVSNLDAGEFGFAPEWIEASPAFPYAVATRPARETAVDESVLLREVDGLIQLLLMLGLERTDDGTWVVPPPLREFARESLRREGANADF